MSALVSEVDASPTPGLVGGPVAELIRARARSAGERAFIEHAREERSLSFRDLAQAVEHWASVLAASGIGEGATVGLVIGDPIDFSVAFLGTMAAGRWAAPLDPTTPAHGTGGLLHALARVGADVVFADHGAPDGADIDWVDIAHADPAAGNGHPATPVVGTQGPVGWCGPGLVGHDRRAQGDPPAPGATAAHGTQRCGAPSPHVG